MSRLWSSRLPAASAFLSLFLPAMAVAAPPPITPNVSTPTSSAHGSEAATVVAIQNPGAITSATIQYAGLDSGGLSQITPNATGRVIASFSGTITNGTAGQNANLSIYWAPICAVAAGSSSGGVLCVAAPSNGNAVGNGQACGSLQNTLFGAATALTVPFTIACAVTGLSIGTPYWFDLGIKSAAGAVTIASVTGYLSEF